MTKPMKKHALYAAFALLNVDLWFHVVRASGWEQPVTTAATIVFGLALTGLFWEALKLFVKQIDDS